MSNQETKKVKKIKTVKLCSKCEKVKTLIGGFYKAGSSYQKLCKLCHNEKRLEYPNKQDYTAKPTGFLKLPEALRKKIIYDVHVQVNFKDIWKKYKTEYPQVKHQTLLRWNRLGQVPDYKEPE
jgi:hypothetical protein